MARKRARNLADNTQRAAARDAEVRALVREHYEGLGRSPPRAPDAAPMRRQLQDWASRAGSFVHVGITQIIIKEAKTEVTACLASTDGPSK